MRWPSGYPAGMSGLRSLLPSRGLILGTVGAFLIGLFGSWAGQALAMIFTGAGLHGYVSVAAAIVVGAVGGALGRSVVGLLALWLGVVAAAMFGAGIEPPLVAPLNALEMALAISLAGYGLGRMVDPIWGGGAG